MTIVQETGSKTIYKKKTCKKAEWLSGEALQIPVKRSENKGEKERYTIWMQSSKEVPKQGERSRLGTAVLLQFLPGETLQQDTAGPASRSLKPAATRDSSEFLLSAILGLILFQGTAQGYILKTKFPWSLPTTKASSSSDFLKGFPSMFGPRKMSCSISSGYPRN